MADALIRRREQVASPAKDVASLSRAGQVSRSSRCSGTCRLPTFVPIACPGSAAWDVLAEQPPRARTRASRSRARQPLGRDGIPAGADRACARRSPGAAGAVFDDVIARGTTCTWRGCARCSRVLARQAGRSTLRRGTWRCSPRRRHPTGPARWLLALTTGVRGKPRRSGWKLGSDRLGPRHRVDVDSAAALRPVAARLPRIAARCTWYRVDCHAPAPCPGGPNCPHHWHAARNHPCPTPRPHATCPPGRPCAYTARLCPEAKGGPHIVRRTKSRRDRIVLLTPATLDALRALKHSQDADCRAAGGPMGAAPRPRRARLRRTARSTHQPARRPQRVEAAARCRRHGVPEARPARRPPHRSHHPDHARSRPRP